jgi:hypothetical protein
MSVTEASLETNFNTYIGDTSTDRISAAERLQFATEAVAWLQEETGNDHTVKTYTLNYYDNVHTYKVTSGIASLLEGADLRRGEQDQLISATHKSSREMAENIASKFSEFAWAIERRDSNSYLVVNLQSKYKPQQISSLESTSADGGTWAVDSTNSDATNLTVDTVEYKQGAGSLNFDITVAQSGNNKATIQNTSFTSLDLSSYEDLGAWVFWAYLPDVTYTSSITLYWGSSTSAYWSSTVTTDVNGNAFAAGWNRIAVTWASATKTLSPSAAAITYLRFDINYTGSQVDDTDYRLDDLTMVRPEPLTFYYTSSHVGTNSGGTPIFAFTATTDIPYFSGQYDQYKYAVAHKMASLAFYGPLQVPALGSQQEVEAIKALNRVKKLIPVSVTKEMKRFKVGGISFGPKTTRRTVRN